MRLNVRHAARFASNFRFIDDLTAIDDGEEIKKRDLPSWALVQEEEHRLFLGILTALGIKVEHKN